MKTFIILLSVLVLTACAAQPFTATPVSTETTVPPTQTAAVIVQTVIVTVVPTNLPTDTPTQVPTATPLPTETQVPPTQTQAAATQADLSTATSAPAEAASGGLVTLDSALGGGCFTNLTLTAKALPLRCQPSKQITFMVTLSDASIKQVLYDRMLCLLLPRPPGPAQYPGLAQYAGPAQHAGLGLGL